MSKIKNGIYAWRFRDGDYAGAWIKMKNNKSLLNFLSNGSGTVVCRFKDDLIWDDYFPAKCWVKQDNTITEKEYYIKGVQLTEQEFFENKVNLYLQDMCSN